MSRKRRHVQSETKKFDARLPKRFPRGAPSSREIARAQDERARDRVARVEKTGGRAQEVLAVGVDGDRHVAARSSAARRPVLIAAPLPRLSAWRRTRAPAFRPPPAVASVEPSSTTEMGTSWPTLGPQPVDDAPTVSAALNAGMMNAGRICPMVYYLWRRTSICDTPRAGAVVFDPEAKISCRAAGQSRAPQANAGSWRDSEKARAAALGENRGARAGEPGLRSRAQRHWVARPMLDRNEVDVRPIELAAREKGKRVAYPFLRGEGEMACSLRESGSARRTRRRLRGASRERAEVTAARDFW